MSNLSALAAQIYNDNKAKGFWDEDRNTGECLMLMVSELAEAMEADRKNLQDSHLPQYLGLHVELADCLIRVLDFCGAKNIPIDEIVQAKLEYNRTRPHKHGKKY